jgi:DNA-binding CsgD family transcriptional regulator
MADIDQLVTSIYDCAIDPLHWPATLTSIRDTLKSGFVLLGYMDISEVHRGGALKTVYRGTEWDAAMTQEMVRLSPLAPCAEIAYTANIDSSWSQMQLVSEEEFQQSRFYLEWAKSQNVRDCLAAAFLARDTVKGIFTAPSLTSRRLYDDRDRALVDRLLPHIRRAMAINGIVDETALTTTLYRKLLDTLSVAIFIVAQGGRLVHANAIADKLLADNHFVSLRNRNLVAAHRESEKNLEDAIARAISGDAALGLRGIGVPLSNSDGERSSAYVLPIAGNNVRGELGLGHAAVFIAQRGEQQPMAIEILRTIFDLTPTEARVAHAVSLGGSPESIAVSSGSTIDTVRTHLKNIYIKTDVKDKTALAAKVNALMPPVGAG